MYGDDVVNKKRGKNYPIMNINERVLSVLGCRYVDDVLIDAPWEIPSEMLLSLGISTVCNGTFHDPNPRDRRPRKSDPYAAVKQEGMYVSIESDSNLSVNEIVNRINHNREQYEKRFKAKKQKEDAYYEERYGASADGRAEEGEEDDEGGGESGQNNSGVIALNDDEEEAYAEVKSKATRRKKKGNGKKGTKQERRSRPRRRARTTSPASRKKRSTRRRS